MNAKIPRVVLLSVSLLIAAHAVGLWQMVLLSNSLGVALWMPYSALAVVYSALATLFVMILRGKRWARTAYTLIAVFNLLSALQHVQELSALGFVVASAKVVAVVLLYVSTGERWFSQKNSSPAMSAPASE
jgi:hypothetical protein